MIFWFADVSVRLTGPQSNFFCDDLNGFFQRLDSMKMSICWKNYSVTQ